MEVSNKSASAIKMRERLKAENPNYQKQENKRIADLKKRKRNTMNEKEKEELRRYERDRKRLQRAKKKQDNLTASNSSLMTQNKPSPYSCKATLSKAVWRTARSLPTSPRKQQAVVTGLAQRFGVKLMNGMEEDLSSSREQTDYSVVTRFFFRPDIVYTCPGMKDAITIWVDGRKEKLQKHYLTMFLKEAFCIFKEENPDFKIGYSKFCSLRPKNVLLLKETPGDQCKCRIHENFILKLNSLSPKCTYSSEFWKNILCNDKLDSLCWKNVCDRCSNGKLMPGPSQPNDKVIWKTWEKNSEGRLQLSVKETCLGELFKLVISDLPAVMDHVNTKRIQQNEFECDKREGDTRILQIDFAMSFSCEYQNEIQSALWSRTSVLLFTAAVFYKGKCKTYLICSDCQSKDRDTVFVFIDFLYEEIIRRSGRDQPKLEIIWSDGPSSEFKNKYMVKVLQILSKKYNREFGWKYFATAHGKGVIDGIGGNVKRLVRQKMMAQGDGCIVQSAKDFAEVASQIVSRTHIFYVEKDHILTVISSEKPWENVVALPGIKSCHVILCKKNALAAPNTVISNRPATEVQKEDLSCGQWVIVAYEGIRYPGMIVQVHAWDKIEVSVMIQAGVSNYFKWPKQPDSICYTQEEIVKKLQPPDVVNNRGLYKFSEFV